MSFLRPHLFLVLALVSTPLLAAEVSAPRQLEVQAESSIDVMPDRATISAALQETTPFLAPDARRDDEALRKARSQLETRSRDLIQMLERQGIEKERLHAGNLRIQNEQQSGTSDSEDARERMVLVRSIDIDIHDLTGLPGAIDALLAHGVDHIEGIRYDISDRQEVEDQALRKALSRARQKAELMARTLDVRLDSVQRIQETRSPVFRPMMMATARSESESAATYSPGNISVEAGVLVNWSLATSAGEAQR